MNEAEREAVERLRRELAESPGTHWRDNIERSDMGVMFDIIDRLTAPSPGNREIAERIVAECIPQPASHEVSHPRLTDAITDALNALSAEKDAEIERLKESIKDAEETSNAGWQENHDCEQLLFAAEARAQRAEALLAERALAFDELASRQQKAIAENVTARLDAEALLEKARVCMEGMIAEADRATLPFINAKATLSEITLEKLCIRY